MARILTQEEKDDRNAKSRSTRSMMNIIRNDSRNLGMARKEQEDHECPKCRALSTCQGLCWVCEEQEEA